MNRIDLIDEINKLEMELRKTKDAKQRGYILSKIVKLETKIVKLDNKTIN